MEVTGKITNILAIQSGTGKTGNEWKKQEIIIQTEEQYPKNICITLWGKSIFFLPNCLLKQIYIEYYLVNFL